MEGSVIEREWEGGSVSDREREWEGGGVSDRERENGRVEGSVIERMGGWRGQ